MKTHKFRKGGGRWGWRTKKVSTEEKQNEVSLKEALRIILNYITDFKLDAKNNKQNWQNYKYVYQLFINDYSNSRTTENYDPFNNSNIYTFKDPKNIEGYFSGDDNFRQFGLVINKPTEVISHNKSTVQNMKTDRTHLSGIIDISVPLFYIYSVDLNNSPSSQERKKQIQEQLSTSKLFTSKLFTNRREQLTNAMHTDIKVEEKTLNDIMTENEVDMKLFHLTQEEFYNLPYSVMVNILGRQEEILNSAKENSRVYFPNRAKIMEQYQSLFFLCAFVARIFNAIFKSKSKWSFDPNNKLQMIRLYDVKDDGFVNTNNLLPNIEPFKDPWGLVYPGGIEGTAGYVSNNSSEGWGIDGYEGKEAEIEIEVEAGSYSNYPSDYSEMEKFIKAFTVFDRNPNHFSDYFAWDSDISVSGIVELRNLINQLLDMLKYKDSKYTYNKMREKFDTFKKQHPSKILTVPEMPTVPEISTVPERQLDEFDQILDHYDLNERFKRQGGKKRKRTKRKRRKTNKRKLNS